MLMILMSPFGRENKAINANYAKVLGELNLAHRYDLFLFVFSIDFLI